MHILILNHILLLLPSQKFITPIPILQISTGLQPSLYSKVRIPKTLSHLLYAGENGVFHESLQNLRVTAAGTSRAPQSTLHRLRRWQPDLGTTGSGQKSVSWCLHPSPGQSGTLVEFSSALWVLCHRHNP